MDIAKRFGAISTGLGAAFVSVHNPNFRPYLAAQMGSNIGNWIQITAENWLVLQLTHSALALGITNALQFGPLLAFGLYGGVIADRFDRRRLLILTQGALALLSLAIGVLVARQLIQLWMIWGAALVLGCVISIDRPALNGFLKDLVGDADLPNAVALNNAVISSGRMIGPAISGFLIATLGLAPSFFINALSFVIVVCVLGMLDVASLHAKRGVERKPGQVREGLSYIRQDRVLMLTVAAMFVVFVAAYNFQVIVPILAFRELGGSSALFGVLMSTLGLGGVAGSLFLAAWVKPGVTMLARGCGLFGVIYVCLALPLGTSFTVLGIFMLGICFGFFNVTIATTLQCRARDDVRGRVMATYSMGILGSGLIGAPLAGALADTAGVTATFLLIATVCAVTGLVAASRQAAPLDAPRGN